MTVETSYYTQKKDRLFVINIIILGIVSISTLGLFGANWYIEQSNATLSQKIADTDELIAGLKNNKKIQIFDLVEANKIVLKNLKAKSQITTFIKHLKTVSYTYDMVLQKFDYSNGIVTTKAVFSNNERGLPYNKLATFINDYRTKQENIMQLLFVNSVSGQDQIEITAQFKLK